MSEFNFDASFWVAIAFFSFIALLVKLKVPSMLTRGLDNHAHKVRVELETAAHLRREAEALAEKYSTKLQEADAEISEMQARTQRELAILKEEAEKNLSESILRRTKSAETRIFQAEQAALQDLNNKIVDLSISATEHLIKAQMQSSKSVDIMDLSIKHVKSKLSSNI